MIAAILNIILAYSTNWKKGDAVNGVLLLFMYVLVIILMAKMKEKCHLRLLNLE